MCQTEELRKSNRRLLATIAELQAKIKTFEEHDNFISIGTIELKKDATKFFMDGQLVGTIEMTALLKSNDGISDVDRYQWLCKNRGYSNPDIDKMILLERSLNATS